MNATEIFNDILTTFKNDFDPETDGETIKRHFNRLMKFGEPLGIRAMQRYLASSTSSFFDWSELMNCLKEEIAKTMEIPTTEKAWGIIIEQMSTVGGRQNPQLKHVIVLDAVNAIGGWRKLNLSDNSVSDRHNFFKVYESIRENYLTEVVTDKWQQA